jgi:hypothetical protein
MKSRRLGEPRPRGRDARCFTSRALQPGLAALDPRLKNVIAAGLERRPNDWRVLMRRRLAAGLLFCVAGSSVARAADDRESEIVEALVAGCMGDPSQLESADHPLRKKFADVEIVTEAIGYHGVVHRIVVRGAGGDIFLTKANYRRAGPQDLSCQLTARAPALEDFAHRLTALEGRAPKISLPAEARRPQGSTHLTLCVTSGGDHKEINVVGSWPKDGPGGAIYISVRFLGPSEFCPHVQRR